jgi:glyoxylase-like metal-dependent hydrolase (beta-lactamase superfamily II)
MGNEPVEIRKGIISFEGKISRNLLIEPIVSHTYLLEDGNEVFIFDPSCGKNIAKRIEAYIQKRHKDKVEWEKAFIIAGHSHIDHANNFYLSDKIEAGETHIYVHESGFENGKVMNEPVPFIITEFKEMIKYYNPFLAYFFPYNLLLFPIAVLNILSTNLALKIFSTLGGIPFPGPVNGTIQPEPLKEKDSHIMDVGGVEIKGWKLSDKMILPTPGHSPCSVSLLWPEKKALFISDADWIGNPVFMSSSLKGCISSLKKIKDLVNVEKVDLLLPAHGGIKEGKKEIITHLEFHIKRLEAMREEVLSFYSAHKKEKDIRKLTKKLVYKSPLFGMLKKSNYPRFVLLVHNIVALSLKEEGILS